MLSNNKDSIFAETDGINDLIINSSQYLGYECIVNITSWNKGIAWSGITETEIITVSDISEFGVPFVSICNTGEADLWLSTFPESMQERLIDYELKYEGTVYVLLWFISRSQYACELFETNPLLVWLVLKTAQSKSWDIKFIFSVFLWKRTKILSECGLDESKAVLNIIQKLRLEYFKQYEFELITEYDWMNVSNHLSHLPYIDGRLLRLLKKHPELETSKLIQKFDANWEWQSFEMTFRDTLKMADDLEIVDIMIRIRSCESIPQLTSLHDRLVSEINDKALQDMPLVEYGEAPIKETSIIVPITNNHDLHLEGRIQQHCISSYHNKITSGNYYAYQILKPERATLGLNKTIEGGYIIDQVYLKCNGIVSDATRELIMGWLNSGIDEYKMVGS